MYLKSENKQLFKLSLVSVLSRRLRSQCGDKRQLIPPKPSLSLRGQVNILLKNLLSNRSDMLETMDASGAQSVAAFGYTITVMIDVVRD